MLQNLGALNFVQSEWGTSPKSPVLDSTTVIDGQVKGSGLRIVFLNLNLNPNLWIMLLF
jgi:hypothetical protein